MTSRRFSLVPLAVGRPIARGCGWVLGGLCFLSSLEPVSGAGVVADVAGRMFVPAAAQAADGPDPVAKRWLARFGAVDLPEAAAVDLVLGPSGELTVRIDQERGVVSVLPSGEDRRDASRSTEVVDASAVTLPADVRGEKARAEWVGLRGGSRLLLLAFGEESPYRLVLLAPEKAEPRWVLKGQTGATAGEVVDLSLMGTRDRHWVLLTRSPASPNLCGRTVPFEVQRLDEKSGSFRSVAVPALSSKEREQAVPLNLAQSDSGDQGWVELSLSPELGGAVRRVGDRTVDTQKHHPAVPHAVLEIPSSEIGTPQALRIYRAVVSAGPASGVTAPSETASSESATEEVSSTESLAEGGPNGGAQELFLVGRERLYQVKLPAGAPDVVTIPIPGEVREECLAVVQGTLPWIGEVTALVASSSLGGKTPAELSRALGGGEGDRAARALAAYGADALPELLRALRGLNPSGRRRGEKVASAWGANERLRYDAELVAVGTETDVFRAKPRLEAAGDRGIAELAAALDGARPVEEHRLAEMIAELAPQRAPGILTERLNQSSPARRLEIRRVLAGLGEDPAVRAEAEKLFDDGNYSRRSRSELVRSLAPFMDELSPQGKQAALSLLTTARFHEAYRLASVLVELSAVLPRAQSVARTWLLGGEPKLDDKQRAALQVQLLTLSLDQDVAAPIFQEAAHELLGSPEMRVRRASARYLGARPRPAALEALGQSASRDDWPEVRAQALLALSELRQTDPGGEQADALVVHALGRDREPLVRAAAAHALDSEPTERSQKALRRALAKDESNAVRAEVARSLGLICDQESLEPLTRVAQALGRGAADEADVRLGLEAAAAVARLGPPDLETRLRPLLHEDVPGILRARVEQVISRSRGQCASASSE